jgi:hypothetical protein
VTGEIRAEPDAIVQLANETLTAADQFADALAAARGTASPPGSAYGNCGLAASAHATVESALAGAETAVDRLTAVYEGDVDRLYRVAFAYRQADAAAADRNRRPNRGPI